MNSIELIIPLCECTCGRLGCWSNQKLTASAPAPVVSKQHAVQEAIKEQRPQRAPSSPIAHGSIEPKGTGDMRDVYREEAMANLRANGYLPGRLWTSEEIDFLRSLKQGDSIFDAALILNRPYHGTRAKLGEIRRGEL